MGFAWTESAECLGTDPELFHPERGEHEKNDLAIETCNQCPVWVQCLDYAISEHLGVWGRWRAEHRANLRRGTYSCPSCGSLVLARHPRLFCDDDCLAQATTCQGVHPTVKARIDAIQDELSFLDRWRRRHLNEPKPVDQLQLAAA